MALSGPPVTIVTSGGMPVKQAAGLTSPGMPMTVVSAGGAPVQVVSGVGGAPVLLLNPDGTLWSDVSAPTNSVAPVISGTTTVGQTLTTTNGTWANTPTSYTYQWKRDGANIGSATASTYALVAADAGASITCAVTATNAAGSNSATSNTLGPIVPAYGEVFFQPLLTNAINFGSWSTVIRIKRANFLHTPGGTVTKARVTVRGKVDNMYIGLRAGSGDEYDFAATPTPVLFNGATAVGTNAYDFNDSDVVAFTDDGTSDILIAQKYPASPAMAYGDNAGAEIYFNNSGPDPSIVNKSGYSDFGASSWSVEGLQLDGFSTATPGFLDLRGVAVGNSLTNANGSYNVAYPAQLTSLLRYGTRITNFGVAGRTTPQLVTDHQTAASYVAGAFAIIWEIGNDLQINQNAANAITNLQALIAQVAADGYAGKILVATGITRGNAGLYGNYATDLATVNASLRTNYASWGAAGVIDFQADARLQNSADTTYFGGDQLHLTTAGSAVCAELANTAVRTLYGL